MSNIVQYSNVLRVTPSELKTATRNWSIFKYLDRGTFGFVYEGKWNNKKVAIKKLNFQIEDMLSEEIDCIKKNLVMIEVDALNHRQHKNIVNLYGFCVQDNVYCLVYEFVPNGTLHQRIYPRLFRRHLKWSERLSIAIDISKGLDYLHNERDQPLIHGDIKPLNILLDRNLVAKIGDFGLAREGVRGQMIPVDDIFGTLAYLPPEFQFEKLLSTKMDVYAFGITLWQLATSKKEPFCLFKIFLSKKEDVSMLEKQDSENFYIFFDLYSIAQQCIQREWIRPDIEDVLAQLEDIKKD